MDFFDFVILGGGIAGTRTAEAIRKNKPDASIAIFTDEKHPLYSRILLPVYLRGQMTREKVFLRKIEDYQNNRIEYFMGKFASKFDPQVKKVIFSDGSEVAFGKLLIATGGKLIPWSIKGANAKNVFYFRTIDDAEAIRDQRNKSQNGIVVGGGFIGLELSESFNFHKVKTTFLIREPWFWEKLLDRESGEFIREILTSNGVSVATNEEVVEVVSQEGKVRSVRTNKGRELPADIIGVGIGIAPDLNILKDSAVEMGRGIMVNEYLECNQPGIFAAGDVAEFYDVVFARRHILGNWANASTQGNVAGANMTGEKMVFQTVSTYTITVFDNTFSFVGETDPKAADKIIVRGSKSDKKIGRILFSGGKIIGATLINLGVEMSILSSLIREKKEIGQPERLADLGFDLKDLTNS